MDSFIIERGNNTLYVNFDNTTCKLELKGTSIPEDSHKFFSPLSQWIIQLIDQTPSAITIDLQFDYMNTSSSKWILKILQILADYHITNKCVNFNWYYDDSDMYDTGYNFQSLLNVDFYFIEYR